MKKFISLALMCKLCAALGAQTDRFAYPELTPVVIYDYGNGNNEMPPSGIGSMFWAGTNTLEMIVPEHLYRTNNSPAYTYAFRIAQPDSPNFAGFLGHVIMTSREFQCDIAIVSVTNVPTPVKAFSESDPGSSYLTVYTDNVVINGESIKTLRSSITGKNVPVIGYILIMKKGLDGKPAADRQKRPLIILDEPGMKGKNGEAFLGKPGEIFLGTIDMTPWVPPAEEASFRKILGPLPGEIIAASGPISLEFEPQ